MDRLATGELWAAVTAELRDDEERLVANLSITQDMKPGKIQELDSERFPNITEVYRIKRSALDWQK